MLRPLNKQEYNAVREVKILPLQKQLSGLGYTHLRYPNKTELIPIRLINFQNIYLDTEFRIDSKNHLLYVSTHFACWELIRWGMNSAAKQAWLEILRTQNIAVNQWRMCQNVNDHSINPIGALCQASSLGYWQVHSRRKFIGYHAYSDDSLARESSASWPPNFVLQWAGFPITSEPKRFDRLNQIYKLCASQSKTTINEIIAEVEKIETRDRYA